jgi:hypothetical protein
MTATPAERVIYAAKSRKWNSTQNNKFPVEFPAEHAANLEWIRQTEEEAARRQADEGLLGTGEQRRRGPSQEFVQRKSDGMGKWIIIGVIGIIIAMRAWQRYKESTL